MRTIKDWMSKVGVFYANTVTPRFNIYNATTPCATATLTNAGEWYLVSNSNLVVSDSVVAFSVTDGVATYTGTTPVTMLFNGSAYVEVSAAAELSFSVWINGVLVPGCIAFRDYVASDKSSTLTNNDTITIYPSDVIEVKAMSNVAGLDIVVNSINVTMVLGS